MTTRRRVCLRCAAPLAVLARAARAAAPDEVTRLAGAYLEALQAGGRVGGTLKHFPGLGGTTEDPHEAVPHLTASRARLASFDWVPFRDLLARGDVAAVMVTHVFVDSIDAANPASLSPALIDGILRASSASTASSSPTR